MRRWSLLLLGLPVVLVSWLTVLAVRAIFGGSLKWEDGRVLTLALPEGTRVMRYLGITFGYGVVYAPGRRSPVYLPWSTTQKHEHVHVKQFEGWCVAGSLHALAVGVLTGSVLASLFVWALSPAVAWCGYTVAAWLRGGHPYWDAAHEEAARAIAGAEAR